MPSTTVENYLRHIYMALGEQEGARLSMGQLASVMNVVPGTATAMVKTLAEAGLVAYEPYAGVSMTPQGRVLALHMVRRHRLLELFLVKLLGLDWSQVDQEADHMEHAVSDRIIERIDHILGHPQFDPHGDPIPTSGGAIHSSGGADLTRCPLGRPVKLIRVTDQDPGFLTFLQENALSPPTELIVTRCDPQAGTLKVRVGEKEVTLSHEVAAKLLVEV